MTLSEFILDNTDDGRDIVRILIDVMNDYVRGAKLNHRLTAARLLTIYGFQDAHDFIDENIPHSSEEKCRDGKWVIIDPELSKLIRTKSNDGREICLFLIDVMQGRVEGIHVGHRVSAARELLNRAFGKSQSIPLPNPPRSTAPRGSIRKTHQRVSSPGSPASVRSEPVEGQSVPPTQTAVLTEPEHQPEPEADGDFDPDVYRAASKCIDPNFDPMLAASDDDYFWSYDGCEDIRCPYHGDPEDPDFDPNDYHY